ncbi:hypothetical protein Tco_1367739 [Tanacetum coccineum]
MNEIVVEDHTRHLSVITSQWEDLWKKMLTMPTEDIDEEDIEETTMVGIPEIGVTDNQETITEIQNLDQRTPSMPHYGKFLKDLVSNKSKMEQIYVALLNKLRPKLGDPRSFKIPYTLANSVEYLALADLGASINLMPNSLYTSLSETTLKPIRMNFVILQMEEDDKVPLILGRPFLYTTDAIIRVKNKELNLGVEDDRITFIIDKAMQHSYSNDDTYFRMDVIDKVTEEELECIAKQF